MKATAGGGAPGGTYYTPRASPVVNAVRLTVGVMVDALGRKVAACGKERFPCTLSGVLQPPFGIFPGGIRGVNAPLAGLR